MQCFPFEDYSVLKSTLLSKFPIYFQSKARTNILLFWWLLQHNVTFESSDISDSRKETLQQQYERVTCILNIISLCVIILAKIRIVYMTMSAKLQVRRRTNKSHVMQYGDMSRRQQFLVTYMGGYLSKRSTSTSNISSPLISRAVNQRDTKLHYFQHKVSALNLDVSNDIYTLILVFATKQCQTFRLEKVFI